MPSLINEERQEELRVAADKLLTLLRETRDDVMATEDPTLGRPHSHGEVDNTRGLALRSLSLAITGLEASCKDMITSFFTHEGEYSPLKKLKKA